MRQMLVVTATVTTLLAFAAPASAATIIGASGTPLAEMIKNSSGVDGNTVVFTSVPSNLAVDYSSTDVLHASSTGGFAFVEGATDAGFTDLTIVPETFTFSAFKFNLHLPSATAPAGSPDPTNKTVFSFDTTVFFAGGGSETFNDVDLGKGNGENRFLITAGAGQAIDKIVFSDLMGVTDGVSHDYDFDSLRQASFNVTGIISPVPEPATWAMFILGFGLMGGMLRMSRSRQAAAI
jgi:hypothetical protein